MVGKEGRLDGASDRRSTVDGVRESEAGGDMVCGWMLGSRGSIGREALYVSVAGEDLLSSKRIRECCV